MRLDYFDKQELLIIGELFYTGHENGNDFVTISAKYLMDDWIVPPGIIDIVNDNFRFHEEIFLHYYCKMKYNKLYVKGCAKSERKQKNFYYYIPKRKIKRKEPPALESEAI